MTAAPHEADEFIRTFFLTVFAGTPPHARIEVRLFLDGVKGKPPVGRHWFATAEDLLDALPRIADDARSKCAGVFFGVLPRKDDTSGESHNTLPSRVVWADIDFKDYAGGETEARKRLAKFPILPSIVVRTGHGLHVYWLLNAREEPARISVINTGIRDALGSDNVQDAARVLRAPGTFNVKAPESPIACEIESIDPSRTIDARDFDAVPPLDDEPVETRDQPSAPSPRPAGVAERISDRVLGLFDKYPKLQKLFEGTGKTAVGDDGKPLDTTSSGYDFSVVLGLAAKGVTDEHELATVLWHRKDDGARTKGIRYIRSTVRSAIAKAAAREKPSDKPAFTPAFNLEKVRIFLTDPRSYELTIDGAVFTCTAEELLSPGKFAVALTNATQLVPPLPKAAEWREFLAGVLEKAERVDMPPEATRDGAIRESIERILPDLGVGEVPEDLDRGKALEHDGVRIFKAAPLLRRVVEDIGTVEKSPFYRVLRVLGYESDSFKIAGKSVRAWRPSRPAEEARR